MCIKYIYVDRKNMNIYSYLYHWPSKSKEETNLEEQNGLNVP